jgi:N utilization substance protein A
LLGWKIDIKSEEEKRQEVEQQMQSLSGGPSTPIEQVTELGDGIIQKLIAAGITTVETLADMTPEQLEEIPGIGEKTLERISVAVRHYFGHFEEGAAEVENADEVVADAEAEAENAAVVVEELESLNAAETDSEPITAMEEAVEKVPDADEVAEASETASAEEQAAEEEDA